MAPEQWFTQGGRLVAHRLISGHAKCSGNIVRAEGAPVYPAGGLPPGVALCPRCGSSQ